MTGGPEPTAGALAALPAIFAEVLPGLAGRAWPEEPRSDCRACTMLPPAGEPDGPRWFRPDVRCCSFHPDLPNFLLGRVQARGGPGVARIEARLTDPAGVDWYGIAASDEVRRETAERRGRGFGREVDQLCPYWVGGELACGVWPDRGAMCRTWFCRHDDGPAGRALWTALRRLLFAVEGAVSRWCVDQGHPEVEPAGPAGWSDWYRECARRSQTVTAADLDGTLDALPERLAALAEAEQLRCRPMPEVLMATVGAYTRSGDRVWLADSGSYDRVTRPWSIFRFLARLDGETTWRAALDATRAEGVDWLDEDGVTTLFRLGLLSEPEASWTSGRS